MQKNNTWNCHMAASEERLKFLNSIHRKITKWSNQERPKQVQWNKQYFSWSGYKVTRISATAKFAMPIKSGTTHRSSICFHHSLKNFDHEASGNAHRVGLHTEEMQGAQPGQDCLSSPVQPCTGLGPCRQQLSIYGRDNSIGLLLYTGYGGHSTSAFTCYSECS